MCIRPPTAEISGIRDNFYRITGYSRNGFWPRFAVHETGRDLAPARDHPQEAEGRCYRKIPDRIRTDRSEAIFLVAFNDGGAEHHALSFRDLNLM